MKRLVTLAFSYLISGFMWVAPANANIVTNGGFETGNFNGWSLSGDTAVSLVGSIPPSPSDFASSGTNFAFFNTTQGVTIEQDLATVTGANYLVEFMLRYVGLDDPAVQGDVFVGLIPQGKKPVLFVQLQFPAYGQYGHYQYVTTATTSSLTSLQFVFTTGSGKSAFLLDDVSVSLSRVPTPATIALLGLGLVGIGATRRKRA
jgi:PEP-CTERM motif